MTLREIADKKDQTSLVVWRTIESYKAGLHFASLAFLFITNNNTPLSIFPSPYHYSSALKESIDPHQPL